MERLKTGFAQIAIENDPGRISVEAKDGTLTVKVKKIGDYVFSSDAS